MRRSDVTVVMCTYNGERFVEGQLDTILRQTLPPFEVIVSDDGSTDRTLEIVESVAATSIVPIRVYRNPGRLGYADNFLRACDKVESRYVAFSDQDDEWAPRKLEAARAAVEREAAILCVHAVELMDSHGAVLGDNRSRWTRSRVVPPEQSDPLRNYYGFTMLFDRSLLDRIPASARGMDPHTPNTALAHDRWVYFLASTFGRTVMLDECLARYRQHGSQLYGGEVMRTRRERITSKLATGREQALYRAGVAAHRAGVLESYAPCGDDPLWVEGTARWRTIESHYARRARLYDDVTTVERLARVGGNVRRGAYRSVGRAGLGPRHLAEDLSVVAAMAIGACRQAIGV